MAPSPEPPRPLGRRWPLAMFVAAFLLYNLNLRTITAGDNYPTRYLPFAICGQGTLTLAPVLEAVSMDRANPYWVKTSVTGEPVSMYPVVLPVLLAPLYAPATAWLSWTGWAEHRLYVAAELMEKLLASALAAAGAAILLALLLRRTSPRDAVLLSAAYAFATNTWATSSQGLWQHTLGQLLLIAILGLFHTELSPGSAALTGLLAGLQVANRPFNVLLLAPILVARLWRSPRAWLPFGAGFLVGAGPFVAYNLHYFDHPGGFYAVLAKMRPVLYEGSVLEGLAGLLVSPSKGLLVFSPFLLFLVLRGWRRYAGSGSALDAALGIGLVMHLVFFAQTDFTAGSCYGPRFMVDALPALIWLLPSVLAPLGRWARAAFVAAMAWGIAVQAVGAFRYPMGGSDGRDPWDWRNPAFLVEAKAKAPPPRLAILP